MKARVAKTILRALVASLSVAAAWPAGAGAAR